MKNLTIIFAISVITNSFMWGQSITGTWKLAGDSTAISIGNNINELEYSDIFQYDLQCLFDDEYIFNEDGSFENRMQSETFIEPWQGGNYNCDNPVAPHDGMGTYSWSLNESNSTITIVGVGGYLGIPRFVNGYELNDVSQAYDVDSITYNMLLVDENTLKVNLTYAPNIDNPDSLLYVEFTMNRQTINEYDFYGTWKFVSPPEQGSHFYRIYNSLTGAYMFGNTNNTSAYDCLIDDLYVFQENGTFQNNQGELTSNNHIVAIDPSVGGVCSSPVYPQDNSNEATWTFDESSNKVTINGVGAYLGLPFTGNNIIFSEVEEIIQTDSINYDIKFSENKDTMYVTIDTYDYINNGNNSTLSQTYVSYLIRPQVLEVNEYEEILETKDVSVFPNPFNSSVNIVSYETISSIQIYNSFGKVLKTIECEDDSVSTDLSEFSNGTYILMINHSDNYISKKIITKN